MSYFIVGYVSMCDTHLKPLLRGLEVMHQSVTKL